MIVLYEELVLHVAYFFAGGLLVMPLVGLLWGFVVKLWKTT